MFYTADMVQSVLDENVKLRADLEAEKAQLTEADSVVAGLRQVAQDWLRANAPGGWIDDLRVRCTALQAQLDALPPAVDLKPAFARYVERMNRQVREVCTRLEVAEFGHPLSAADPPVDRQGEDS